MEVDRPNHTSPYLVINEYWEGKTDSKGSPYMWHIDMGAAYLKSQKASQDVLDAWFIHPIIQDASDLKENHQIMTKCLSPIAVMYCVEYRHQANWYSTRSKLDTKPRLNILPEVAMMLKADKLQNRWNLSRYRKDHPNYEWLNAYFNIWFNALGIKDSEANAAYELFDLIG